MKADYYRDDKKATGGRSQKTFDEEADALRATHHQQHAGGKDYLLNGLRSIITHLESFNKWMDDNRIEEILLEISALLGNPIEDNRIEDNRPGDSLLEIIAAFLDMWSDIDN